MQLRALERIVGGVVALAGMVSIPPMAIALALDEGTVPAFAVSLALTTGVGGVLWLHAGRVKSELRLRDGFLVTTLSWLAVCLATAVPFMLAPPHLSWVDAVFESTSGVTTTGATVIVGLDALPRSVLFYRQSLHFIGGMGIVILAVAILPMLRIGGLQLFRAEISGTVRDVKLAPRVAEVAKLLWLVYVGLTVLCTAAYWAAGMHLFDAVGHAFSTVATAGFSTHDASIGHYDSPMIEAIAVVFMVLGATNFSLHYAAWRRASSEPYRSSAELRLFLQVVVGSTLVVTAVLFAHAYYPSLGAAFRQAVFQVTAGITTTGFTSSAFYLWPGALPMIIIVLSFCGGCAGSTTGGLKVRRLAVMLRLGVREMRQLVHPRGSFIVRAAGQPVGDEATRAVAGFVALYLTSLVIFAAALASTGLDLETALSSAAACLNNLGPALGMAGPDYSALGDTATVLLSLAMLMGRLEILTLLVLLMPAFWRE
ncbi:MAG TPA: potassium transporter TrkG [Xanthomonadaceae bacterium]|nr:potassium transporter TrkG [Xanthomonadaceae bacterium]